ncbi:nucleotidyltransferase [Clostridium pasteurianum DSM 525 = ATCC 6013]|uniref:DNA polymerase beta domain protein region n=1 Tax=Clostridium pasteurianum DSM 525 = ATCC 6013 TaxID=1262449 RepID=A0A0H3J965_CLOPA|nr:nucleotidyltransferase domain-containing protein [Clostridium pasteurianum]AJA48558.1 nucleotidyltransferase [Clostridium pasteurianum DSM 525 = ATCC 6013]AJA52546.1 nucleotidyltransferase [Clostridium pasteurianum DSM 525 = ATCC 6013]AOZ75790.1 nucleotidyltransferase [Clostridium pasteurianum DSM 525 = ATCC 6013]AOZ79586.1 nucleotidyltransferase [Clostridium pasteurianum]ELP57963.1 nucleotidyltransferase [Clostridium pasteurianum DSM 525 = ATCC 6013]
MNNIIDEVKRFIININKKYAIKFAYIFGSQATGKASKNSDVDIAVYFKNNYTNLEEAFIRGEIIEEGKSFFKKNIDIVSLNNASLLLKYEIIHDGIVIKDDDERGDFESLSLREYFDFKYYSDIYDNVIIEKIKKGEYFRG